MKERAEALRRRIAPYREYLHKGVDIELAAIYAKGIVHAEFELADIEDREKFKDQRL